AAVKDADLLARAGFLHLDRVWDMKRRNRVKFWTNDPVLSTWFGTGRLSIHQIRLTRRRIRRVHNFLANKRLRIRLKEQKDTAVNGHNYGGPFSPKTFVLFPAWFAQRAVVRPGIIVHELFHQWFIDHKDNSGNKYGAQAARNIARQKPIRARRNPENYEHYVLNVFGWQGNG
ncbi:M35 family metallo-endopeptidase, partial [Persicitalea sp.]|uniref:M35 family metallo-endopeptidase n=1 Tax=Persicitalea sp. TaxID=3100273 RepID=UPI00359400A7